MDRKFVKMTEDEFDEKFNPIENHIDDNASFDGCMFETYGEELEFVRKTNDETPRKVWTIIEGDSGKLYYSSGYHFVNRLGYLITEEEIEEGIEIEVELEGFGEFQCGSCEQMFDAPTTDGECCPHCGSGNFVKGCIDEPEKMEDEGDEHSIEGDE